MDDSLLSNQSEILIAYHITSENHVIKDYESDSLTIESVSCN